MSSVPTRGGATGPAIGGVGMAGASVGSSSSSGGGGAASADGYGLLGLLGVIRMTDRDLSTLALGADLTTLHLNLHAPEPLHTTFGHPWAPTPTVREPVFTLPQSFKVPQPALKTGHFSKFDVGTLLYIFYAMPRDILQAYAAQELYSREWRYHREAQAWYKRASAAADGPSAAGATSGYVVWDVASWEKRPFNGNGTALAAGFLSEEEARVKAPAPPAAPPATTAAAAAAAVSAAAAAAVGGGAMLGKDGGIAHG